MKWHSEPSMSKCTKKPYWRALRADRQQRTKLAKQRSLTLEILEVRQLLATVHWIGGSGDWNVGTNWDNGVGPGAGDDVVIDVAGDVTVTHTSGQHAVASVTAHDGFTLAGGTLTISGELQGSGLIQFTGGTLENATIGADTTLVNANPFSKTFRNITVDGTLDMASHNSFARFEEGLTVNGLLSIGSETGSTGSVVNRVGVNVIEGTGTLLFGGSAQNLLNCEILGSTTTIGPDLTVRGKSGTVGRSFCPILNQGTIHADTPAGVLTVNFGDAGFASSGTLRVSAGTLVVDGNWAAGHTEVTGGVLHLDGAFEQESLGIVTRGNGGTAGEIHVLGDVTGGLLLNDEIGPLLLHNGHLIGGTLDVEVGSTATLKTFDTRSRLSGVTINKGLEIGPFSWALFDENTVLNQTLTVEQGALAVNGLLAGTGTVVFGPTFENALRCGDSLSMTIGTDITVRGQRGTVGAFNCSLVNQGTIHADTPEGRLIVDFHNTPTPSPGTLKVSDGDLVVRGNQWRSAATEVQGGILTLQGDITSESWGVVSRGNQGTAGRVNLAGILSGGLTLNDDMGSIYLTGGTLIGGTLSVAPGHHSRLIAVEFTNQFSGVTIESGLDMQSEFGAQLLLKDESVLNQTLQLGGTQFGSRLTVDGLLSGSGTIIFGAAQNSLFCSGNLTMTIGPNITVRGRNGSVGAFNCNLTNQGTIHAEAGGTIAVLATTNYANGVLSGGTWRASDGATLQLNGAQITSLGADVTLDGVGSRVTHNVAGAPALVGLNTIESDGSLSLKHGVNFSTSGNLAQQGRLALGPGSTMTVTGALTQGPTSALFVDIGGPPASSGSGRLQTTGHATMDGVLDVRLIDGYGPISGLTYQAMTFGSRTGDFTSRHLSLGSTPLFSTAYVGNTLEITTIADAPNLTLVDLQSPAQAFIGNYISVPYSVRNTSATATPTGWRDAFYLSLDPVLDTSDLFLGEVIHTAPLAGNANRSGVLTASIPRIDEGLYYLLVVVDSDLEIPDLDRSQNVGASTAGVLVAVETHPLILGQRTTGHFASAQGMDRWTFAGIAGQQLRFDSIAAAPNKALYTFTGPNGFSAFNLQTTDSDFFLLPSDGTYTLEARSGSGTGASTYSFQLNETSHTLLPLETSFAGTLPGTSGAKLFEIPLPSTDPLLIEMTGSTTTDQVEIYAKFGSPPNRQQYDFRSSLSGAHHLLQIPLGIPGKLYVMVYSEQVPGASSFTLRADRTPVYVDSISPATITAGMATEFSITGLGFRPGATVQLIPAGGGAPLTSTSVDLIASDKLSASVQIPANATGAYDVRVLLPDGSQNVLQAGLQVQQGQSRLETRIISTLAPVVGIATFYVEYANTGTATMPAPLLTVVSDDAEQDGEPWLSLDPTIGAKGFWTSAQPNGFRHSVQFLASGESAGWLQPGEKRLMPIQYIGVKAPYDPTDNDLELELLTHAWGDPTPIPWSEVEAELRPAGMASEVWSIVLANLQQEIGSTWGDYHQALIDNAVYLDRLGQQVRDASVLWGFELQQAIGLDPFDSLVRYVDGSVSAPGVALEFDRSYANSIVDHYELGPFGYGWTTQWQSRLEVLEDNTVVWHRSSSDLQRFQPDRRTDGAYWSENGSTVEFRKLSDGRFEITDRAGLVTQFHADGRLDHRRDVHGNTVTAGYSSGRLTSLTHSSGGSLTLSYNAGGRISSLTDSQGRVTSYVYDASNTHLIAVTDAEGTITYQYAAGQGAAREHALSAILDSTGVSTHFEYDAAGRLVSTSSTADHHLTSIVYEGAGEITITDIDGVATKWFLDANGLLARIEDANGYYENFQFDHEFRPVSKTDATGRIETQQYTTAGARSKYTNAQFRTTSFDPVGPRNLTRGYVDANNNETGFKFDTLGNVTVVTYPDSSQETTTYDGVGNIDLITNRRGQTVDVDFNAAGQVTRTWRADGTTIDYTYNAHGRLASAIDASGTTTLTYDASERLTGVIYPNGRWLQFEYDSAGRRTRVEDHTGHITRYRYDSVGRMQSVRGPEDALVVQYTYTPAGRVAREEKGNGTSTEYTYDAVGRTATIVHRAPSGDVSGELSYSYDLQGRISSMSTPDGTWTYAYDLTDQLLQAHFASTNALIANQDLVYEYDAVGNRVRTTSNGAITDYTSNAMNQVTSANATTYQYDLDGNVVQESGPQGVRQYTYDPLSRLIGVQTPQGTWQYEYDVFGNRSAVIANGQRTEYLIDPTGIGEIMAEYSPNGGAATHYVQGLGLVSRTTGGSMSYYEFDLLGSTTTITDPVGAVANSYAYQPFGDVLMSTGAVPNPFGYIGARGVMDDGNGLYFMRARHYSPALGRFQQQDPIRLAGGDYNMYRYVANDPVNMIDPSGLAVTSQQCGQLGGSVSATNGSYSSFTCFYFPPNDTQCSSIGGTPSKFPIGVGTPPIDACNVPIDDPPPPPLIPPAQSGQIHRARILRSIDPNEKFGATGFGPQAFIHGESPVPYSVHFENLGPGSKPTPTQPAEAPAQRIEITDQLSSHLDWTTFEFKEFGVGDIKVPMENAHRYYFTTLELTQDGTTFAVEVEMAFNVSSGHLRVVFQAIDPATFLPPDVQLGVLPPEDGSGRGQGYFNYEVRPKVGLATGTEIRNIALIQFDANPVIATNQIDPQDPAAGTSPDREALNTIDSDAPTSAVNILPALVNTKDFTVNWSGSDDALGAGIATYDVYVSIDNEPYVLWLSEISETSAAYAGSHGHSYSFYSVATDQVGNVELKSPAAESHTRIDFSRGDFDGDQLFDCRDINSLVAAIAARSLEEVFDLTSDMALTVADIDAWLAIAGAANLSGGRTYLFGDANLDGQVDGADFNIWNSHRFKPVGGWCEGDFNADGVTDASDFNVWNQNKFAAEAASLAHASRVPQAPLATTRTPHIPAVTADAIGSASKYERFSRRHTLDRPRQPYVVRRLQAETEAWNDAPLLFSYLTRLVDESFAQFP
jgi:RHS repeat-associated protein